MHLYGPKGAGTGRDLNDKVSQFVQEFAPTRSKQPRTDEDVVEPGAFVSGGCKLLQGLAAGGWRLALGPTRTTEAETGPDGACHWEIECSL